MAASVPSVESFRCIGEFMVHFNLDQQPSPREQHQNSQGFSEEPPSLQSFNGVNIYSHVDVVRAILKQLNIHQESIFLNLLQHLLGIDAKEYVRDIIWNTAEKLVHRATLVDSQEDAECLLRITVANKLTCPKCSWNDVSSISSTPPISPDSPSDVLTTNKECASLLLTALATDKAGATPQSSEPTPPSTALPPPPPPPLLGGFPPPPTVPEAPAPPGLPFSSQSFSNALLPHQHIPKPKAKMKTINWSKIPIQRIHGKYNIWTLIGKSCKRRIKESIDFHQLEELFCLQSNKVEKTDKLDGKGKNDSGKVHLIDGKRSLNINIFLKQFKGYDDNEGVTKLIRTGNHKVIGPEKLKGLLKLLPEAEEIATLQNYDGDWQRLGSAEKFLLLLLKVPNYKLRIECMLMKEEFTANITYLEPSILAVIEAGNALMDNGSILDILYIVVVAGNYLNSGGYAGNAAGVNITSLTKLTDIRANKPGMHLMHFLVTQIEKFCPDLLNFPRDLGFLENVSKISLEQIGSDIRDMDKELLKISAQLQMPNIEDNIKEQMMEFLQLAGNKIKQLKEAMEQVNAIRLNLAEFFCEDAAKFQLDECFKIFYTFSENFTQSLKENEKRQLIEKQTLMRQKQKDEKNLQKPNIGNATKSPKNHRISIQISANNNDDVKHSPGDELIGYLQTSVQNDNRCKKSRISIAYQSRTHSNGDNRERTFAQEPSRSLTNGDNTNEISTVEKQNSAEKRRKSKRLQRHHSAHFDSELASLPEGKCLSKQPNNGLQNKRQANILQRSTSVAGQPKNLLQEFSEHPIKFESNSSGTDKDSCLISPDVRTRPKLSLKTIAKLTRLGHRYSSINEDDLKETLKSLKTPTIVPDCILDAHNERISSLHESYFNFDHETPPTAEEKNKDNQKNKDSCYQHGKGKKTIITAKYCEDNSTVPNCLWELPSPTKQTIENKASVITKDIQMDFIAKAKSSLNKGCDGIMKKLLQSNFDENSKTEYKEDSERFLDADISKLENKGSQTDRRRTDSHQGKILENCKNSAIKTLDEKTASSYFYNSSENEINLNDCITQSTISKKPSFIECQLNHSQEKMVKEETTTNASRKRVELVCNDLDTVTLKTFPNVNTNNLARHVAQAPNNVIHQNLTREQLVLESINDELTIFVRELHSEITQRENSSIRRDNSSSTVMNNDMKAESPGYQKPLASLTCPKSCNGLLQLNVKRSNMTRDNPIDVSNNNVKRVEEESDKSCDRSQVANFLNVQLIEEPVFEKDKENPIMGKPSKKNINKSPVVKLVSLKNCLGKFDDPLTIKGNYTDKRNALPNECLIKETLDPNNDVFEHPDNMTVSKHINNSSQLKLTNHSKVIPLKTKKIVTNPLLKNHSQTSKDESEITSHHPNKKKISESIECSLFNIKQKTIKTDQNDTKSKTTKNLDTEFEKEIKSPSTFTIFSKRLANSFVLRKSSSSAMSKANTMAETQYPAKSKPYKALRPNLTKKNYPTTHSSVSTPKTSVPSVQRKPPQRSSISRTGSIITVSTLVHPSFMSSSYSVKSVKDGRSTYRLSRSGSPRVSLNSKTLHATYQKSESTKKPNSTVSTNSIRTSFVSKGRENVKKSWSKTTAATAITTRPSFDSTRRSSMSKIATTNVRLCQMNASNDTCAKRRSSFSVTESKNSRRSSVVSVTKVIVNEASSSIKKRNKGLTSIATQRSHISHTRNSTSSASVDISTNNKDSVGISKAATSMRPTGASTIQRRIVK